KKKTIFGPPPEATAKAAAVPRESHEGRGDGVDGVAVFERLRSSPLVAGAALDPVGAGCRRPVEDEAPPRLRWSGRIERRFIPAFAPVGAHLDARDGPRAPGPAADPV